MERTSHLTWVFCILLIFLISGLCQGMEASQEELPESTFVLEGTIPLHRKVKGGKNPSITFLQVYTNYLLRSQQFKMLAATFPNVSKVQFKVPITKPPHCLDKRYLIDLLLHIASSYPNLSCFIFIGFDLTPDLATIITAKFTNLTHLDLSNTKLNEAQSDISNPSITHLTLSSDCYLKRDNYDFLTKSFPNINEIELRTPHNIIENRLPNLVQDIASWFPNLTSLGLAGCTITPDVVTTLSSHFANLANLDLNGTNLGRINMKDIPRGSNRISTLDLSNCTITNEVLTSLIDRWKDSLVCISLDNTIVSFEMLQYLLSQCQLLQTFYTYREDDGFATPLTADQVVLLKQIAPQCSILYEKF